MSLEEKLIKEHNERPEVAKLVTTVRQVKCGLVSGQNNMSPYQAHLKLKTALLEYFESTMKASLSKEQLQPSQQSET